MLPHRLFGIHTHRLFGARCFGARGASDHTAEECHVEVAEAFDELYCPDESIVSYMDRAGLSTMFPKTRAILNDPPRPLPKARVAMDSALPRHPPPPPPFGCLIYLLPWFCPPISSPARPSW